MPWQRGCRKTVIWRQPLLLLFCGKDKERKEKEERKDMEKPSSFIFPHGDIAKIPYGGDYNPEQWPEEIWEEDMRLFRQAGIDCVTLNVFSWVALQPDEETYSFEKLDKIMDMARENRLHVILATSTAAHPAWMARRYPEVLRVEFNGMKRKFGGRHNSCPNSPVYQKYSARLAGKLALRYGEYENLIAWHVNNEYGGECYCENCEKAFRLWLQEKYKTLEEVNRAWNTSFWGHTFYDWDEIVAPNLLSEHFGEDRTMFQGISLDYRRFFSDSLLENFRGEYEAIKQHTPDIPITTNLMGFYKPLDYQKWGRYMDFISWDNYPANETPPAVTAMNHDLMRGIGGGKPFALMEQTPSVTNWLSYNALKRPGVMRLLSYQAVAHGADSVLFFQMRRTVGACEKYHGAVIDHAGHGNTRVFREIKALGGELKALGSQAMGSRTPAKAAILVSWENWWALEYSAGPSCDLKYLDEVERYYTAFYEQNIPVDIISSEDPLDGYGLVVLPVLYLVKDGIPDKLKVYVEGGGTLIATYFSGIVDQHDLVALGGYPGRLRSIFGIWVEETDALPKEAANRFIWKGKAYPAELLCDIMHMETAREQAVYELDFYAGTPVISCNQLGKGKAWYIGTRSSHEFYHDLISHIAGEIGLKPVWNPVEGVEITERRKEGVRYLFFLNHKEEEAAFAMELDGESLLDGKAYGKGETAALPAKGVMIFRAAV